jgi:hypothetical protein
MPSATSSRPVAWEVTRLLGSEAARMRAAVRNTLGSTARAARLRAARQLVTAIAAAGCLAWSAGWMTGSALGGDLRAPAIRRLVASAFLLFVFVIDGFGRGAWTRTRWEGRFEAWLLTAGVHPTAVAVRHAVLLILRVLPFSWMPLLPLQPDLALFPTASRLALLLAAPACGLAGDTIGVLSRRGSRWIGAAFGAVGAFYWVSLLLLLVGRPSSESVLIPARTLLLSRWNVATTVTCFAVAAVVNSLADQWGSGRARALAGAVRAATPARRRSYSRAPRPRHEAVAHADAAVRRLSSWVSQQWIATVVVGTYALLPIVAITMRYSGRAAALPPSEAILPLAFGLALPALVCAEVVWGTLPRDMWSLFRINARSLYVPIVAPGVITVGVLSIWVAVGAAMLAIATPAGLRSAGVFAGTGLLVAAHCASLQELAGALALRAGGSRTVFGRAIRYGGTAAGVLVPALITYAAGFGTAIAWVGFAIVAAPMAAVAAFSRCQFTRDLHAD